MFSFLAWIFWLAVFLGAVVLMGGVLVSDMEADDQKKVDEEKKVNEENEVDEIENYLNTWPATGIFISSLLAAILSSWWMGFLYVLIFFFILLWFSLVYKTLSFFGFEFNNKGSEMVRKFQKEFSANGFTKKYTPIATTIFASFFIATISLYGLDSGSSSNSSSFSSNSSSSSSRSSSSEVSWKLDGNGCPTKNGQSYGYSPVSTGSRIFDIAAAQGRSLQTANSLCIQCLVWQFNDTYRKFGTTGSVTSPKTEVCSTLTTNIAGSRGYWDILGKDKTYK